MSAPDRRRLVDRDNGQVSIRRQCELLGIARSGLYRTLVAANDNDAAPCGGSTSYSPTAGITRTTASLRRRASAIRLSSSRFRAGDKTGTTIGFEGFEGGERGAAELHLGIAQAHGAARKIRNYPLWPLHEGAVEQPTDAKIQGLGFHRRLPPGSTEMAARSFLWIGTLWRHRTKLGAWKRHCGA